VALSIRYLAGGRKKDNADSSVDRCIVMFLDKKLACEELQIKAPSTGRELRKVANGFSSVLSAGIKIFDGCIGAIVGWIVQFTKPHFPNSGEYNTLQLLRLEHHCGMSPQTPIHL
jgi:hypothetical protein